MTRILHWARIPPIKARIIISPKTLSILAFIPIFLSLGCAPSAPYFIKDYEIGKIKEATVGSVMMAWEVGIKTGDAEMIAAAMAGGPRPHISNGFRKQLIYSGIAQNVVNITYREFNVENQLTSFARPAFSQELKYDISNLDRITFQDVKIQIICADSEKIRFSISQGPSEVEKQQSTPEQKSASPEETK